MLKHSFFFHKNQVVSWSLFWHSFLEICLCFFSPKPTFQIILLFSFRRKLKCLSKILLKNFVLFFLFCSFFYSACFLVCSFSKKKRKTAWCKGCHRGPDQWQLNVRGLNSLNNVTARGSVLKRAFNHAMQSSTHEKKVVILRKKKVICFQIFRKNKLFSKKKKSPGIDGVRQNRDEGDKKPFCPSLTTTWRFPGREETRCSNNIDAITLESFQMPTPTLELSTARKNVVKSATAECTTALDMPPRRPSLPVSRSNPVTPPAFSGQVVLLVDKEELLVWSVAATKDLVWWHMETSPDRERTSWSRDTLLTHHWRYRVAPRQTLLDQTEKLPPPLGHCGGRRTAFWSHFVVHDGAGRAKLPNVVEETVLLFGDGIQGAKMRTVPSRTGSLQRWKLRKPLSLKMANCPWNFPFFCDISARNNPQTNRFLKKKCFYRLFWTFWKRDIFWTKSCSKFIIWISLKRKKMVLATNPSLYKHRRWRSHAAFSCHWSRPRDIWCIKSSLLFLLFFEQTSPDVKK